MESILLGITASVFASFFVLFLLSRVRPQITISPVIAYYKNEQDNKYVIKIINIGKRKVVDVRVELLIVKIKNVPGGSIFTTSSVSLIKDRIFILSEYSKKDQDANYAYRFRTEEDLHYLWEDDDTQMIRFRVYGHDEVSGFGRVFEQDYRVKRVSLLEGEFKHGKTFDIG